ncbi:MAG: T9SS type A sorting domain-containing protein [Bacteroidales bacterium]|nr:T9SS type A sorting domain-containing protein [Bacteroidales bacterium]
MLIIFNSVGLKVKECPVNDQQQIDVSQLSPGLYIIKCINAKGECIQKFIKSGNK